MSNFWQRALTGTAFVAVIILSLVVGYWSFKVLFFLVALLSLLEFYKLISNETTSPQKITGIFLGAVVYLNIAPSDVLVLSDHQKIAMIYSITGLMVILELYRRKPFPFHSIAYTIIGVVYVVIPFALLTQLSVLNTNYDYTLPLGIFLLIWSNDTFAYLTGIRFGKHRLFERISPKKSWEGSAGGLIMTLIVAFLLSRIFEVISQSDWLVTAAIVVVAGTLGDLVESMLKRSVNAKDSGNILPGHGGLLDRFDALLLAVPFIYIYLVLL